MTTDQEKDKQETATSGQPHLAKQSLVGLDVGKLTPLSPEVSSSVTLVFIIAPKCNEVKKLPRYYFCG